MMKIDLILLYFKENFAHEAEYERGVNVRRALAFLLLYQFWATPLTVHNTYTFVLQYSILRYIVTMHYITLHKYFNLDNDSDCPYIISD